MQKRTESSQTYFILGHSYQIPDGRMFISSNNKMQTKGSNIHRATQVGVSFCNPKTNMLCCEICKYATLQGLLSK